MADINLYIDDYLELDYLKEQIDSGVIIKSNPSGSESNINHMQTKKSVFNPKTTGLYELKYDGDIITVNVYDYINFSEFTPELPYTYNLSSGYITISTVEIDYSSNPTLQIEQDGARDRSTDSFRGITRTIDLTSYSTLNCTTKLNSDGPYDDLVIRVGTNDLLQTSSSHSWTERTFDISDYSGSIDLKIGHTPSGGNYRDLTSQVTDVYFE